MSEPFAEQNRSVRLGKPGNLSPVTWYVYNLPGGIVEIGVGAGAVQFRIELCGSPWSREVKVFDALSLESDRAHV